MKKYLYLSLAALLTACAADDTTGGGDQPSPAAKLVQKSAISANFQASSVGVTTINGTAGTLKARAGVDTKTLYCINRKNETKEASSSVEFFNLICNKASGLFHGDNGWAVKSVAQGSQDNNRRTYCYYIDDDGKQTSLVPNTGQGLFLHGEGCDLSKWNDLGRPNAEVPNSWFDTQFAASQQFIDDAIANGTKVTDYYKHRNGGGNNEKFPFTYYDYQGYKVVLVEYAKFVNQQPVVTEKEYTWLEVVSQYYSRNVTKVESDMTAEDWASYNASTNKSVGTKTYTSDDINAPWFQGCHDNDRWDNHVSGDPNAEAPKVILVPMTNEIEFSGTNINASIFAPGKKVSTLNGGAADGLIVCDEFVTGAETHASFNPEYWDPTPSPETCEADVVIDLDVPGEYVVVPDDFAIHNGDKLYEKVAIEGVDHQAIAKGEGAYVKVEPGNKILVKVDDICSLYPEYVGKLNAEGQPYISEDGVLTIEVYIWPGTLDAEGKFSSILSLGEGYLIGIEDQPVEYLTNNKDYSALVSAYKGYQGKGEKEDGTVDQEGWSYVKVSIHITPKNANAAE